MIRQTGLWLLFILPVAADVEHLRVGMNPPRLRLIKETKTGVPFPGFTAAALSGDGRFCAARTGNSVVISSTYSGQKVAELDASDIHDAAISYDGKLYCTAHNEGTVRLWDVATGKEISSFQTGSGYSCAVNFTKDGKTLVADNGDRTGLIIYSVADRKEVKRINGSGSSYTFLTANGRYALVSTGGLRVVDLKEDKVLHNLVPNTVVKVALSPDSRHCVGNDSQGQLVKWDIASGQPVVAVKLEGQYAYWPEYSPDGKWISFTEAGKTLVILDARTLAAVRRIELEDDEEGGSHVTAFSKDSQHLVVVSMTGRIRIYASR